MDGDVAGSENAAAFFYVHDLPQLYTKPQVSTLYDTLELLKLKPLSLSVDPENNGSLSDHVDPAGVARYLTSIISSTLNWIEDETSRERIWAAASARLSERSGRSATGSMRRSFEIPVSEFPCQTALICLHEPSLTSDNLGFKTWTSSVLLSRRLASLRRYLPRSRVRALELGAGTGLVGLAAACAWRANVALTDLPEILPNLQSNIKYNNETVARCGGEVSARPLDWADTTNTPPDGDDCYPVILAADPLYSPEHPRILVDTVCRFLQRGPDASFIIELPLRDGYHQEREELKARLMAIGLKITAEGTEHGREDWQSLSGEQAEVECWWSLWQYRAAAPEAGEPVFRESRSTRK